MPQPSPYLVISHLFYVQTIGTAPTKTTSTSRPKAGHFSSFEWPHRPSYSMAFSFPQDGPTPQDRRPFSSSLSVMAFYPLQWIRRPSSFLPTILQMSGDSSMVPWLPTGMQSEPFILIPDMEIYSKTLSSCSKAYKPSAFSLRGSPTSWPSCMSFFS